MNFLFFENFVNEGIWSKGVERSKTGSKRQEDNSKFDIYVKNIEWVDMGHPDVLYAKLDYEGEHRIMDENLCFSFDEIQEIVKNLPEGVSIMSKKQIEHLKRTCEIKASEHGKNSRWDTPSKIICNYNGNSIEFNLLCKYSYMSNETLYYLKTKEFKGKEYKEVQRATIGVHAKPTMLGRTTSGFLYKPDRKEFFFKLVKSKQG